MNVCVGALSCTWGSQVGHCRAPIDCSMPSSLPLSCSAATSLPPPTHSSPMNTRGTYIQIRGQTGKQLVISFQCCDRVKRHDNKCHKWSTTALVTSYFTRCAHKNTYEEHMKFILSLDFSYKIRDHHMFIFHAHIR